MEGNEILEFQMKLAPSFATATNSEVTKKWPGPVSFDEERSYVRLSLTIPQLKKRGFIRRHKNEDNVKVTFTEEAVSAEVMVDHSGEGQTTKSRVLYTYVKKLPEDINPDKSTKQVEDGHLVLKMAKKVPTSWSQHYQYLLERPDDVPI